MDDLFAKKKRKPLIGLQLAALIDIFMLIIIFLIKSTTMSGASISPPKDLNPARSQSPEGVEPAGQVYLTDKQVHFAMINESIPTTELVQQIDTNVADSMTGQSQNLRQKLKEYLKNMPATERQSGVLVNFLADAAVDYKTTFSVSKFCREAGFESILFVAEGEK